MQQNTPLGMGMGERMTYRTVKYTVMGCPRNYNKWVALDWCEECEHFRGKHMHHLFETVEIECGYPLEV